VMCMPGWIFRTRATASAMDLFGPWPDSSMRLAEVVRHSRQEPAAARHLVPRLNRRHHQERGIASAIQYPPWAQPNIINSFASPAAPGL
jgi:hypothetical protein